MDQSNDGLTPLRNNMFESEKVKDNLELTPEEKKANNLLLRRELELKSEKGFAEKQYLEATAHQKDASMETAKTADLMSDMSELGNNLAAVAATEGTGMGIIGKFAVEQKFEGAMADKMTQKSSQHPPEDPYADHPYAIPNSPSPYNRRR